MVATTMRGPQAVGMIGFQMTQTTTRIVLDVQPGPPIHGAVRFGPPEPAAVGSGAGEMRTFSGWIELLTVLQTALSGQTET